MWVDQLTRDDEDERGLTGSAPGKVGEGRCDRAQWLHVLEKGRLAEAREPRVAE